MTSYITNFVTQNRTGIHFSPELGRYLINGPLIVSPQDVLIEEKPFVYGPKCNGSIVCLDCYKPLSNDSTSPLSALDFCQNCGWPLCYLCLLSNANSTHRLYECGIFSTAKCKFYKIKATDTICPQLDCILPLRF